MAYSTHAATRAATHMAYSTQMAYMVWHAYSTVVVVAAYSTRSRPRVTTVVHVVHGRLARWGLSNPCFRLSNLCGGGGTRRWMSEPFSAVQMSRSQRSLRVAPPCSHHLHLPCQSHWPHALPAAASAVCRPPSLTACSPRLPNSCGRRLWSVQRRCRW